MLCRKECKLRFCIRVLANDIGKWVCSLDGEHDPKFDPGPLSLSPLINPSLCSWAAIGNKPAHVLASVAFPEGAAAALGDRFMARLTPTLKQAQAIVAHRRHLLKSRTGASDKQSVRREMADGPKRKKRRTREPAPADPPQQPLPEDEMEVEAGAASPEPVVQSRYTHTHTHTHTHIYAQYEHTPRMNTHTYTQTGLQNTRTALSFTWNFSYVTLLFLSFT